MKAMALQAATSGVLGELRQAAFSGELIGPGEPGYEEHRRVWNGAIDRHPGLIARCRSVADVEAAVRSARRRGLLVAVRGGGHSFPGLSVCDGGMLIDLGAMRGIRIDPEADTVTAQGGVLLGELDRATQPMGLAVPSGIVTHTGVAGLTLGGGLGWIMRKYGLAVDQLRSVRLVTAEGERVRASAVENPDLFWGVRGGGGNFGIVTDFEFHLHRVGPEVLAGPVYWPMRDAPAVLRFYRDWVAESPDELMTIVTQRKAPDLPHIPRELVGERLIAVHVCYAGPTEDGVRVARPMKRFGSPVLDLCHPKPFLEHQRSFDPSFPAGWHYYVRSCDVAELSDGVIDVMAERGERIQSAVSSVALWQMGGAVARVPMDATAFPGRTAAYTFNLNGNSTTFQGAEAERQWARDYWTALAPYHAGAYVNFLMEEGESRVRQAYGAETFARLRALKRAYDPTNLFHLNQNISPD